MMVLFAYPPWFIKIGEVKFTRHHFIFTQAPTADSNLHLDKDALLCQLGLAALGTALLMLLAPAFKMGWDALLRDWDRWKREARIEAELRKIYSESVQARIDLQRESGTLSIWDMHLPDLWKHCFTRKKKPSKAAPSPMAKLAAPSRPAVRAPLIKTQRLN